jgi:DNA-binding NarL/FixJ family response regulator
MSKEAKISKRIKVILVDDHPVVRQSLRKELEKQHDFEVVAEAEDGLMAVKLVHDHMPDVVVMDLGMPKLNGLEATRQIKANYPQTIVLVLTIYDDTEHILGIMKAGADGYLTKNVLVREVVQSIRSVAEGETVFSQEAFRQLLKYALRYPANHMAVDSVKKISPKELEILKLIGKGLSNKEIARDLNIGTRTVKSHVVDIFSKLNVYSRTEAVIYCLHSGILMLSDLEKN